MEGTPQGVDKLDLENMTDGQLQELLSAVKQAISERVERRVADLQNLAREAGFDVQLHRSSAPATGQIRARQPVGMRPNRQIVVSAKYRNPDNPSETWSGRGHQPRWLQAQLSHGRTLADLTIK